MPLLQLLHLGCISCYCIIVACLQQLVLLSPLQADFSPLKPEVQAEVQSSGLQVQVFSSVTSALQFRLKFSSGLFS